MAYSKADIESSYHSSRRGGVEVNIKAHDFGWLLEDGKCGSVADRLEAEYQASEAEVQQALEIVWDCHTEQFWDQVGTELAYFCGAAFGFTDGNVGRDKRIRLYGEGRSGGWLVVEGLLDVENWDAIKVSAWGRFVRYCEAEVKYLSGWEAISETIEANEYLRRPLTEEALIALGV